MKLVNQYLDEFFENLRNTKQQDADAVDGENVNVIPVESKAYTLTDIPTEEVVNA